MRATPRSPSFVGRRRELDVLRSALEEARSGRGRCLLLVGEAGIGKTRTAEEGAALAVDAGFRVLWGGFHEQEGALRDGTAPKNVSYAGSASTDGMPAWSPDGSRIAFRRHLSGNFELYVMDADGSNQTRITETSVNEEQAAWRPRP